MASLRLALLLRLSTIAFGAIRLLLRFLLGLIRTLLHLALLLGLVALLVLLLRLVLPLLILPLLLGLLSRPLLLPSLFGLAQLVGAVPFLLGAIRGGGVGDDGRARHLGGLQCHGRYDQQGGDASGSRCLHPSEHCDCRIGGAGVVGDSRGARGGRRRGDPCP